ncbi:cytochrome P450 [Chromobacterium violaceum]|uniref:cytochrome P450 n=1 Tax=Chromobacterium violaceum TaxID=536 RepID=UPI001BEB3337|nr:cytochrome P450 [Chromobacterium violaceum]MBT2869801.1 cytochrome P450 [Chromobacterium violaceum]
MKGWPEHALAAAGHPDPYPYYRALARDGWRRDEALGLWLAASRQAVDAVLASPACRVRPAREPVPAGSAGSALGEAFGRWLRMSDGDAHARLRTAVGAGLAALRCDEAEQTARRLARAFLAAGAVDGRRLDALADFLPVATLASLLGWPEAALATAADRIARLCRALAADADAAARGRGSEACRTLLAELAGLPAQGWLKHWQAAFSDLDDASLYANLLGILFQSRDAGAGLLSAAIAWRCKEEWDHADPTAWRARLRQDPVLHHTRRYVEEDVVLAGQPLRAGDQVLVLLAAAAHDPAAPEQAMDFGRGRHACPGEALALATARGALQALEQIRPDWRALGGGITFHGPPNVRMRHFGAGERR